jgi:hypothetical protein
LTVGSLTWIASNDVQRLLPIVDAITTLEQLLPHLDLTGEPPRSGVALAAGQLLLMPSIASGLGVKIVTMRARSADAGQPRIQALYLLMDATTLAPLAVIEGIALTNLRTSQPSVRVKRTSDSRLDPVVSVSAAYGPETERSPEQPMRQGVFVVAVWRGIRVRSAIGELNGTDQRSCCSRWTR